MLANRRYCYPLTITDFASRYLLTCEALSTTQEQYAFTVFERDVQRFWAARGHPDRQRRPVRVADMRSTASANSRSGGSAWHSLERIQPGHPQQNGRHERMHLTLKLEATKPAAANVLQQQARFDDFIDRYNQERPHQALGMKVPADLYTHSPRVYRGFEELDLPVSRCDVHRDPLRPHLLQRPPDESQSRLRGTECRRHARCASAFGWSASCDYDLGYFDDETCRLEPIENPFGPNVLPIRPE